MTSASTKNLYPPRRLGRQGSIAVLALAFVAAFAICSTVAVAAPVPFWKSCAGTGAGQCAGAVGIGVDPNLPGHLYVAEVGSDRISELTAWGEFVKAWGWGVRDGAPELQTCGPGASPPSATCQAGLGGSGPGQLSGPSGVTVDGAGDVYVVDRQNHRVLKFSPAGEFLLTFGGGVLDHGGTVGNGTLTNGSKQVTSVATASRAFVVGQTLTGVGIPAETRIEAIGPGTLTLSQAATASASGVALAVPPTPGTVQNNEQQLIDLEGATGGTFTLSFSTPAPSDSKATTPQLPFDAVAVEVGSALEALPNIGAGNVAVSGPNGGPFAVEFKGAPFADTNVASIQGLGSNLIGGQNEGRSFAAKTLLDGASAPAVCTAADVAEGRACGAGGTGTANGQFEEWPQGSAIAAGPGGLIYVGDRERIQKFGAGGSYVGQIGGSTLAGETVLSLAVDPSGDAYVAFAKKDRLGFYDEAESKPDVHKLSGTGVAICTATVANPRAIAQGKGGLYVVDRNIDNLHGGRSNSQSAVREFSPNCAEVGAPFGTEELSASFGIATGSPCLSAGDDVYAGSWPNIIRPDGFVRAYGPSPDQFANPGEPCEPPPNAPEIESQHAFAVGSGEAALRARINPRFWADTRYYVEYGTEDCTLNPCEKTVLFPGTQLGAGVSSEFTTTPKVFIGGLSPNTTYYYRFVAESGGGGPVRGDGGKVGVDGPSRHFTTFSQPASLPESCPNADFRSGPAARLPDCRAYEMVSPLDKGNADIAIGISFEGNEPAVFDQAAEGGKALAFTSYRSFGNAESAPWASHYLSRRGGDGWTTQPISPPREGLPLGGPITGFNRQYLGFTAELCSGWLQQSTDPVLAPGAPGGFPTLYRRGLCGQPEAGGSAYEAIIPAAPSDVSHLILVQPELQGFSVDGTRTVFRIKEGLPVAEGGPSAAPGTGYQVYEESGGALRLVSVLPDGSASGGDNSAGSAHTLDDGRHGSVFRAVSADGTRVYWSTGGTAPLYLRLNAGQDQSAFEAGQCSEAEKACTIKVSSGALAKFLSGSVDGTRALYSEGESLKEFEYDPETGDTTRSTIATGFKGLMGANGDATRAYLASTQQLDGAKGKAGQPNLYFYEAGEEGGFTYIATLAAADALTPSDRGLLSPLSLVPAFRGARVSPDGLHAAFSAVASLTGYDNVDAENGKADAEVFVYDATAPEGEKLHCASCDPSGARPLGRDLAVSDFEYWAAARIPGWGSQLYSSHALSDDGSRLFFDSFQPLVLADTNGVADVYEWEAAGKYCSKESSAFSPAAGGCVRLISSGQSPSGSEFVDADLGGKDVFFKTESSLLPQDPGLIDIYDAREGGGFAPEPPQPAACEGEACQGPVAPPNDPTPASSSLLGTGNANEARPRKKHRKKHQRKRAHKRHAKHDRRASR